LFAEDVEPDIISRTEIWILFNIPGIEQASSVPTSLK